MKSRLLLLFYLLVIYVFASFSWWSYLLLSKNKTAYEERTRLENYQYNQLKNLPDDSIEYFTTSGYAEIRGRYDRQKWMIVGEGLVFLILLSFGSYRLRKTFNKEVELARRQNNFLLSITHELKSPLASLKLSIQTLIKRSAIEEKYRRLADNSLEDVDRLTNLVDNILYAAQMETETFMLHKETENISVLTESLLQKVQLLNKDKVNIQPHVEANLELETDKTAFTSLVLNLVENAVKYSLEKGNVEVHLHRENGVIHFDVKDNGVGIPKIEREKVFKKFYRIGNEETRSSKGTGLGLFIVKKVVDLHGGTIDIRDNQPSGTIISVEFPVN